MRWAYLHHASVTRMYEGTDTRCQDILVGAVLAIGLTMWARRRRALPLPVPDLDELEFARVHPSAGTAGLGAPRRPIDGTSSVAAGRAPRPITAWELSSTTARLAAQVVRLGGAPRAGRPVGPARRPDRVPVRRRRARSWRWPWRVLLFAVVTAQAGSLARALGNPAFVYLGRISYGVYLWHFPLFALMDAERMHLYGLPLLAVRVAVTLVVATASYYLVELPIRTAGCGR